MTGEEGEEKKSSTFSGSGRAPAHMPTVSHHTSSRKIRTRLISPTPQTENQAK